MLVKLIKDGNYKFNYKEISLSKEDILSIRKEDILTFELDDEKIECVVVEKKLYYASDDYQNVLYLNYCELTIDIKE